MLLLVKIGKGKGYYYINLAQQQGELDCTQPGEPPGQWWGQGAERLGLRGTIHRADFLALFEGFAVDGEALAGNAGQVQRVPGWDATFSAVKSVGGILWAVTPPEVQAQIESCHEHALRTALTVMETECTSRYGDAGGLAIALFQHGSNRNGDPLLHTHALILNLVVSVEGAHQSAPLNSKPLYQWKKALGALYRAEFSYLLETELGLSLERVKQWFELKNFTRENGPYQALMNHWSSRRLEIEQEGPVNAQQAQVVAQQTRQAKGEIPPRDVLFAQWREVAAEFGFTQQQAMHLIRPVRTRTLLAQKWAAWRTTREAVAAVVRHQSHFTRRDLIQAMAVAAQARQISSEQVLMLTDRYLTSRHVMSLGQIDGEQRYANRRLYRLEKSLLATARKLAQGRGFRIRQSSLDAAVTRHQLTPEQATAIASVLKPGRLSVLTGITGTGKTHTLSALRDIYRQSGYQVLGVAVSRRSVDRLQEATNMKNPSRWEKRVLGKSHQTMTLQGLFNALEQVQESKRRYGTRSVVESLLSDQTVVLVDDAQRVSTSQMQQLVATVQQTGAKLVLAGDLKQFQSYDHGGALAALSHQFGQAELKTVVRQEQNWARTMIRQVSQGKTYPVVKTLIEQGRLVFVADREQALEQIIKVWSQSGIQNPRQHLMIAETLEDAYTLNHLAQQARVDAGTLTQVAVKVRQTFFHKGDRVQFAEPSYTYGVTKGALGTLKHLDSMTRMAVVRLDSGQTRLINTRLYRGLELGYTVTTSTAQDLDVNHAYVITNGIGREATLVQFSRARKGIQVITYGQGAEEEQQENLAAQLRWSKLRELGVMAQERSVSSVEQSR